MIAAVPQGHIKLARKAFDPEFGDAWWLEERVFSRWEAWVYLLQSASFASRAYHTQYGTIQLERGEVVVSLRHLAAKFQWTLKTVRVWITACQKGARLRAHRKTQAGTVYLIVNYDTYQAGSAAKGTEKGTPEGIAGAHQGHKREAGKAVQAKSIEYGPEVARVLEHFRVAHPKRRPGEKDAALVVRALGRGYSADELCAAIDGNARDEWARKINKHGLSWTLRDNEHIDDCIARSGVAAEPITDEWGVLTARGLRLTAP